MNEDVLRSQAAKCKQYKVDFFPSPDDLKVGVALNVKQHKYPLNGLRINPEGDTTGWYIWAGEEEPLIDADYFKPLHVIHLNEWCPEIVQYLGLPPGWRFLFAPNYEDVWLDQNLLAGV